MKKFNLNSRSARKGGIAFAITAIAIAIIVFLNLIIGQLPSSYKEFDISDQRIYSVSDIAKDYIDTIDKYVEMVIIADETTMDERISKYIYNYAAQSDFINVTEVDPIMYPSVLETYGCDIDTLVIYCQETGKMAQIPLRGYEDSLIIYELDYYTYTNVESQFDAEGQITSAIDRVIGESANKVYTLTGHGETAISASATDIIEKANISVTADLSLLAEGGIPADCSLIICYAPTTDLSAEELKMINDYMANGGDMLLFMDSAVLPNFNTLMGDRGLTLLPGFLGDYEMYYSQFAQYYGNLCIAPTLSDTLVTSDIEASAMVIYPKAMTVTAPVRNTITVEPFMTTSESGLYFVDENTEGVFGQYVIGAVASEETENGTANLTVISAVTLIDSGITDSYPSMSNLDIFLNAVTFDMGELSSISIPAKSLAIQYNVFSNYMVWAIIFVVILPATCLVCGFVVWFRRRKR